MHTESPQLCPIQTETFLAPRIPLSRPDITEREVEAVCAVLRGPTLALGPELEAFECEFALRIGRRRAVAVNSGTSALFLALRSLDVGPGDEVITTPFTFIASTTTILMTGARPVFVDIDPQTWNLDPGRIAAAVSPRTRALLPVEVFGNPAGMDRIEAIARDHGLALVEDSCEALGSTWGGRPAGSFGTLSTFAFYPNKQITTGEGGLLLTDDPKLADRCLSLRNQGREPGQQWLSHTRLGYNFRMSDLNAALGRVQLARLDDFVRRRAQVAAWYRRYLAGDERILLQSVPPEASLSWFVFVLRLSDAYDRSQRDRLRARLAEQGIQTGNYFPPVHLQPFIARDLGYRPGEFPHTEALADRTLALPFYNHLDEGQVAEVCHNLRANLDQL